MALGRLIQRDMTLPLQTSKNLILGARNRGRSGSNPLWNMEPANGLEPLTY